MPRTKKPEVGDLIEIFREVYQHWAIYVGDGYVIHLGPPCEVANAGASSIMSMFCEWAVVKLELLSEVVGNYEYRVNNILDEEYEPRDINLIVKHAHSLVDQLRPYSILNQNCEHFVTNLRYGKPKSRQARNACIGVAAGIGVLGLLALGAAVIAVSGKQKENKY